MAQTPVSVPASPVDLHDVQGDVILGLPKRVEAFLFFTINDAQAFRHAVGRREFLDLIKSTAQIQDDHKKIQYHKAQHPGKDAPLLELSAVNIAFTHTGLLLVQLTEDLGDPSFKAGQLANAQHLGDQGQVVNGVFDPDWLTQFKGAIDGLVLVAGDSERSVRGTEARVLSLLGHSIKPVLNVLGAVRPGAEKGHEHFGYKDGISLPAVNGIQTPLPGQLVVDPGVLLLGQPGDNLAPSRPPWAKNGSILVYRHLDQLVPEFDKFKHDNPLHPLEIGIEQGAELLGARLVGRWKSGAPVALRPVKDDIVLAADPQKNNNFDFSSPSDQTNCPFAAHVRKTNPRSDLGPSRVAPHGINRAGIPFGPEVTEAEHKENKTKHERGLAFVCYQSNLAAGFEFLQQSWANNTGFIFGKGFPPGFDPIIGQNGNNPRTMKGFDPTAQGNDLPLPVDFVVSKGGAYFFSPSISVLKTKVALPSS